jgi:heptosyltransferase-2
MMRIVVFCPNWIGDAVMATPALRALRQGFAEARLVGVMKPLVADTLEGGPWFDDCIRYDHRSGKPGLRTRALVARLRAERFDLAVLFPNSFRSAALAWLAGAPRRVGYDRGGRGFLLTERLLPERDVHGQRVPAPAVGYFLEIARRLGCHSSSPRTELYTTEADERAADRAWWQLGLWPHERVVCLNTGGAFGPAKNWPPEHFAVLARRLAVEAGAAVLVVCGPSEREAARDIVARANHHNVVSLADQRLGIGLSKACIRRSALLVTTDSGPRHFAAPFDVPVLTLFGPTHIAWTRTYHPHAVHLLHPVPCGPCQKRICPLEHHRCMRELDPVAVFAAATRLLQARPVPRRSPAKAP